MLATLVFAALFYGIAEYEHLTGWKWAAASLVISIVVLQVTGWLVLVLPFQAALFGVLWWANSKKIDTSDADQAARLEADRRIRQERVRRAHEQADRDRNRRP
ncbi:MAG: hypothetical protein ACRD08_00480 [Acidimicrobiales bacterium]